MVLGTNMIARQKTVLLTSFHPLISRNILMSGLLPMLTNEARVVLLVPAQKKGYFEEQFGGPNIAVEGVDTALDRHDLLFRKLFLSCTPTSDLFIKKRAEFFKDRKFFSYLATVIPALLIGRVRWCIGLLRVIDNRTADKTRFTALFERYRPDLVVSTDVQNEMDLALMRQARKRGVATLGMVRSWDNLTSKGILRTIPDRLIVHNELIKAEAVKYSFVKPDIISVIGIPHYDRYYRAKTAQGSRAEFMRSLSFDAGKKLILFAPFGDRYIRDNKLDLLILRTLATLDANILVRLPPTDAVNIQGFETSRAKVSFYESGASSWKGGKKVNEVSAADEDHLVRSLTYADVVVTGQSTIAVDACAFDKPVVIAAFDHEPRAYYDSVLRYFDYEYYKKFRERSGVRMARSPGQLLEYVTRSLAHPDADSNVRAQVVRDQQYRFDGHATDRLGNLIITTLP